MTLCPPTLPEAIAYVESLRTVADCHADRCALVLLDALTELQAQNNRVLAQNQQDREAR